LTAPPATRYALGMRAVWIPKAGPPEVLTVETARDPEPSAGTVRIRVRASGVNFADVSARLGVYPDAPPFPCVVGYEVAGTVDAVGAGVAGVAAGQPVVALTRFGGYADTVVVPAEQIFAMPDGMSFETAAAIPVNYLTAVLMLRHFAAVREGETVLVHSAAGGVGIAALQLCRAAGARVIGTASASKHAALIEMGVAHAIDYHREDFEEAVRRHTNGRGVDVVLDATGQFRKSYRCLAPLGRLVCFGVSSASAGIGPSRLRALAAVARIPFFHPIKLMNDNKAVIGVNLGHLWDHLDRLRREMLALLDDWRAGRIAPVIAATYPLERAADAHRCLQEHRNVGKVLLIVDA
jgi:NADPH:quinone reductase-like Zn-dependent oxidoreductase